MAGIWWTKVDLKEDFCEHFCEMTDNEIVSDIRKSINSILKQRPDGNDFGAKMVKKAIERVKSKHDKAVSSGALGGAAKARNKKENEKKTENPVERSTKSDSKEPGDLVYGSCENVFLTQDEFNKIAMDVGNLKEANSLVEDLSLNLADGKIESSNHFATLQKWAKWRKNHPNDERLETFHERDDRNQIETMRRVFSM